MLDIEAMYEYDIAKALLKSPVYTEDPLRPQSPPFCGRREDVTSD